MVGGGGINLSVIPGIFRVLICAPVVFLWCSAECFIMYTAKTVSMDVFADDFERYAAFCRLYQVSLMDGLSVLMDMAGFGSADDMSLKGSVSEKPGSLNIADLIRRAGEGEYRAVLDLSSLYLYCEGMRNPEQAYFWACIAAETGNPEALYQAGLSAYVCGRYDEAFSWFEQGASLKHTDSEFMLGMCYALGHGCSVDKEMAEALLTRAHKKGLGLVDTAEKVFGKIE